jgi:aminoglycoside phosphotransferase family enzyme/predicted kinase
LDDSASLIQALRERGVFPHAVEDIQLVETHISWVLLTGRFAYKIKKPLKLDFLDFSTLELRRRYCEEELRLNRRTAPQLYLEVLPITGSADRPRVGGTGAAIEYAVKMLQFPEAARADHLAAASRLEAAALKTFASDLARFHAAAARDAAGRFGRPDCIAHQVRENLRQLRAVLETDEQAPCASLASWLDAELAARHGLLAQRAEQESVRECHGDLHLSNLVLLDGRLLAFDCIEFGESLRWIDVIDDAAFLVMDLQVRGHDDLAYVFLNAYLAATGDFAGVGLLNLYRMYRTLVRAKVAAIARAQASAAGRLDAQSRLRAHLALAQRYLGADPPVLVLTSGLTGSGKSWLAEQLAARCPALMVRSDVERKRLAGLAPDARSGSPIGGGLYSAAGSARTYARLEAVARCLLEAGHTVIVDAAFLSRAQRVPFYDLAGQLGLRCLLIECTAPPAVLEARITARAATADASEGNREVLAHQLATRDPVLASEPVTVLELDTTAAMDWPRLLAQLRGAA